MTTANRCLESQFASRLNLGQESTQGAVELLRPLQRCEVAHARQKDQFGAGDTSSEVFGMFTFDEFIMLAVDDYYWHTNLSQLIGRIIGLRSLHQADRSRKLLELVRCG